MSEGGKGNGVDAGAILQAVLALGTELRALDRKVDRGLAEVHRDLAEVHRDLAEVRRDLGEVRQDVAALRGEVAAYHGSVVGHGVLISELEERVGRLEQGEPPKAA